MKQEHTQSLLYRFLRICILTGVAAIATATAAGQTKLPGGEVNAAYSYTFATTPAAPDGTTYSATNLPDGLSINRSTGEISGVPTTIGTFDQGVVTQRFPDTTSANTIVSITIVAATGTPEMTSAATAAADEGVAFNYVLTADNSPTSFNVEGDLPAGLSFSGESISGTPTEAGTFDLLLSANNSSGTGAKLSFTLTVTPAGDVPVISSAATASSDSGALFSYQITASNDPTGYTAEPLPVGLNLDSSTGFITGTSTDDGVHVIDITATNAAGTSDTFTLTLTVGAVPQISSSLAIEISQFFDIPTYTVVASNTPTSYTVDADSLPAGLSYDPQTRIISGAPSVTGVYNINLSASNAVGDGGISVLVITVNQFVAPDLARLVSHRFVDTAQGRNLILDFEQTAAELTQYDVVVEVSSDLDSWSEIGLDDTSLAAVITDNQDGGKSISVTYPNFDTAIASGGPAYFRYKVNAKTL